MRPLSKPALLSRYVFSAGWQQRSLLLLLLLVVTQLPAFAQGVSGPSPAATMTTVKNIAVVFLQGAMAVGLIIALVKVAQNFLTGSPEAFTSFMWLMGGTMIFFGWGYYFRSSMGTWSSSSPTIGSIGNANLNPAVSAGAYAMAQGVLDTMLTTVVPLLLFITVAMTIVRGFISSGSVQFELGPIFRVIFLYSILVSYNLLVPQVGNLIGGLAQLVKTNAGSQSTSAYTVLAQMRDAAKEQANPQGATTAPTPDKTGNGSQDGTSLLSGLATSVSTAFTDLQASFSPQKILLGLATDFMTGMIQAIMEFIQSFLLAFLYVSGPIAIAFSLVPGFGGVAKSWLQSLVGIHMWSIAFQVIAGIFAYYSAHEAAQSTSSGANVLMNLTGIAQTKYAVACIVFIVMYIMVPYMSSLIVGSSAADSFVSSAVRIGASLASGGAAAGGAALGVAGAGAQGANAAAAGGASGMGQAAAFGRAAGSHVQNSMGMGPGGNLSNIGKMLAGSPPQMAGAATDVGQSSNIRSATPQGPLPPQPARFSAGSSSGGSASSVNPQNVAAMAGVAGGSTSSATMAAAAAAPAPTVSAAPAPTVAAAPASVVGPAVSAASGGAAGGFGGYTPKSPAAALASAPPIAVAAGQAPPPLTGGRE